MKGLKRTAALLILVAIAGFLPARAARAKEDGPSPVAAITEIKDAGEGKIQWRDAATGQWKDAGILQNLYNGNQLALTGKAEASLFFFDVKNVAKLTAETATTKKPFVVTGKKAKDRQTEKVIKGLQAVSDGLLGREDPSEMVTLSARDPLSLFHPYLLVAPRFTRAAEARPEFEWISDVPAPVTLTVEKSRQELWRATSAEKNPRLAYPDSAATLQAGETYTVRLEAEGNEPEVTHFIYSPLKEREAQAAEEWEKSLPPGNEPTGAVVRALAAMEGRYYDKARRILEGARRGHPKDRTLATLLVKIYVEQRNGYMAYRTQRELEELTQAKP